MNLQTVANRKSYGLITKKLKTAKISTIRRASVFGEDDDDDDNDGNTEEQGGRGSNASRVARVNQQLQRNAAIKEKSIESAAQAALEEDPSVFDYDGSYDTFKAAEVKQHPLSRPSNEDAPKARYVSNLLATAKVREKEKERAFERKLLKERKEEDKEFGDKPKFMTAAYKKKLLEDQKWEYEDKLADEVEQRTDVRKSGMEGFYNNLLTKNVALGGDVKANAVSVYTAGSGRQSHIMKDDKGSGGAAPSNSSGANKRLYDFNSSIAPTSGGSNSDQQIDEHHGSSSKLTDTIRDKVVQQAPPVKDYLDKETANKTVSSMNKPEQSMLVSRQSAAPASVGVHPPKAASEGGDTQGPAGGNSISSMKSKDESISSARERYLARKRGLAAMEVHAESGKVADSGSSKRAAIQLS